MAKKKVVIEFEIDELEGYEWMFYGEDGIVKDENIKEAAEALKASPELVSAVNNALSFMAESIMQAVKADMLDMWKKIEDITAADQSR